MIYLHARGLYHVLLLICNRELMFILSEKHRQLLFTRKLDTCCQAVRQRLYHARLQPHASKIHLKWAVIVTAHTVCVNSNHRQDNAPQGCTTILIGIMSTELTRIVCQILAEQDLIIRERMKTIWRNQQRLMKKEYVH